MGDESFQAISRYFSSILIASLMVNDAFPPSLTGSIKALIPTVFLAHFWLNHSGFALFDVR